MNGDDLNLANEKKLFEDVTSSLRREIRELEKRLDEASRASRMTSLADLNKKADTED